MGVADGQIRVSKTVKRRIERLRREGERYDDVLEHLLAEENAGDFSDGFGRWSERRLNVFANTASRPKNGASAG